MRLLAESESIHTDGTFSVTPLIFQQLYIIMGIVNGAPIALVWCLCTHKDSATYDEIFSVVIAEMQALGCSIKIKRAILDFEIGVTNSLRRNFGSDLKITYCFFHFTQNLFGNLKSLSLQKDYLASKEVQVHYFFLPILIIVNV